MSIGRIEIFTDELEITSENVIKVLQNAMPKHLVNANRCDYLLRYEAGEQAKTREKKYRSDIDCWCVDNIANEVTEFKLGFNWGNPITLVQRGEVDSGKKNETKPISLLNECYRAEKNEAKTQQLARFVEITGLGYTYIDINTDYVDGDSFFTLNVLDPRNTFIIKSSYYVDHRPMLGVSYREDDMGNRYFTCFTKQQRFEISGELKINNGKVEKDKKGESVVNWFENKRSGEENPLGLIPIIEWIRSYDRMGCFERQIPEMDNLNLLVSDFTNDIEQNTQCVWHSNDVDFPTEKIKLPNGEEKEVVKKPKSGDWLQTYTPQDGKTPIVEALAVDYDYAGMLNQMIYRVNRIKEKCNVPQRNDNSGGSTGIAMSDATGWTNAEVEANRQDQIKDSCKIEEVKVVLAAIKKNPYTPSDSPLLGLRYSDVKPSIKRQKNYEMTTKLNAYATGVGHGIAPEHMIPAINFFDDPQQVIIDSKPYIKMYLDSTFNVQSNSNGGNTEEKPNSDRLSGDESDQIGNSPNLDGMNRETGS